MLRANWLLGIIKLSSAECWRIGNVKPLGFFPKSYIPIELMTEHYLGEWKLEEARSSTLLTRTFHWSMEVRNVVPFCISHSLYAQIVRKALL